MSRKSEILLGFGTGLLACFVVSFIVFLGTNPDLKAVDYFKIYYHSKLMAGILSLSLLANLGLFYLFLRFDKDNISRGILGATMLVGIFIFYMKFFLS